MQITNEAVLTFVLSFFGGGGLGIVAVKLFIQAEAKKALTKDLETINQAIADLKEDVQDAVKKISDDYVSCKYCNMQHDNLNTLIKNMDHKLDILIEKRTNG